MDRSYCFYFCCFFITKVNGLENENLLPDIFTSPTFIAFLISNHTLMLPRIYILNNRVIAIEIIPPIVGGKNSEINNPIKQR